MLASGAVVHARYRIIQPIGRGGMGVVYEAVDERLGITVALKQTLADPGAHDSHFEREARLLASLRHPALPRVTDHFIDQAGQFLVLEFIAGADLGALLARRRRPFAPALVLRWADTLLDALDYLHAQVPPVIHRDIKPQNLKLTGRHEMMLLDFGLAKGRASSYTAGTASIAGFTPQYAPPEQIEGRGTDGRSDLYALAATLYRLLTGEPPAGAITRMTARASGLPDPLRPAHEHNAQVPAPVSAVLQQTLALRPEERPADALALRHALQLAWGQPWPPAVAETLDLLEPAGSVRQVDSQLPTAEQHVASAVPTRRAANSAALPAAASAGGATTQALPPTPASSMTRTPLAAAAVMLLLVLLLSMAFVLYARPPGAQRAGPGPTAAVLLAAPLPTATRPAPPTAAQPMPTPAQSTRDWRSILRISAQWRDFCGFARHALPAEIDPSLHQDAALSQIEQAHLSKLMSRWPVVGDSQLYIYVTNIVSDSNEWVRVSKNVGVRVQVENSSAEHVTAVEGLADCGGDGYQTLPTLDLKADGPGYHVRLQASGGEFVSVEPGEPQVFLLPIRCAAPGVYALSLSLDYTYQDEPGRIELGSPSTVVCPQRFDVWQLWTNVAPLTLNQQHQFVWQGQGYELAPGVGKQTPQP